MIGLEENLDYLAQILELLNENHRCLARFEEATQKMLRCPVERLEEYIQERQFYVEQIAQAQMQIQRLSRLCKDSDVLEKVFQEEIEPESVPGELQEIRNAVSQMRTVFNRLQDSDLQAAIRIKVEQERILEKIKATNQGAPAKAARFFSTSGSTRASRLGNA